MYILKSSLFVSSFPIFLPDNSQFTPLSPANLACVPSSPESKYMELHALYPQSDNVEELIHLQALNIEERVHLP